MIGKVRRTAEELLFKIRKDLAGRYAKVPIRIERSGTTWIAVADVASDMTRERIEAVVRRVREYNDLAD